MLFNIKKQCWDDELLSLFNIPSSLLPEVKDSSDNFGEIDESFLGNAIEVNGIAGDQQAALIGQACFKPGMAKSTYGTGCFLMLNTGSKVLKSNNKLLTTVAYRINGETCYALEGSIFVAGAVMQWLRDGIQLISSAAESEGFAKEVGYHSGVTLVPAFTGLGAPYWNPDARGAILGLTRDTGIKDIVTAALMSVGLQTADLLKAMTDDGADFPANLRVDGGMVVNDWLTQSLADLLQLVVDRPANVETTALGVAFLAGLKRGIFKSTDEIAELWQLEKQFTAAIAKDEAKEIYVRWRDGVERVL